jgi:hypothetical protein
MSFKIFTKVLTNRINLVAQKVVSPFRTTFLPDIYIYFFRGCDYPIRDDPWNTQKKKSGVILKLDFEMDYDKVKMTFLTTSAMNKRLFI